MNSMREVAAALSAKEAVAQPVRFSHLKAYGRSAAHGWQARVQDTVSNYAMQRGTAVHALLFNTRKVTGYPGAQRRGKEYEAFVAEHPDHEILTMSEYDKARYMADAVRECQYVQPFFGGYYETKLLFDWHGIQCRATPDIRGLDYLTELKCSSDVSPERFPWHARRMCYPEQLWFQNIACDSNNLPVQRHMIIAVEDHAPWAVGLFQIMPRSLDRAVRNLTLWMERLKVAEQSQMFPAYCQSITPIDEPEEDDDGLILSEADDAA